MIPVYFLELIIDSDCYIVTLSGLKAPTSSLRPEKKLTFFLQHSNTRPHTSLEMVEHIASLGWTVPPHPQYSSDLTTFDFHLFGLIKGELCG